MTANSFRWLVLLAGTMAASWTTDALAQGNVFNPYGNSGYADYREFARPTESIDPSLPGQARLQYNNPAGRNRANQFDSYVNSLDGGSDQFNANRGVASGLPYYQAQRLSNGNQPAYRSDADKQYQELVKRRNEAYSRALAEKDPRKRALMVQQIERQDIMSQMQVQNRRSAASARRPVAPAARPGVTPSAATPRPGTTTNAAEAAPVTNPATVPIPAPAPN